MTRATRIAAALICLVGIILFAYAVPTFYVQLRDHCIGQACPAFYDTPPTAEWLAARGWTSAWFAAAYTFVYTLFGLVYIGAGVLILSKKASGLTGQVAAVALVNVGLSFGSLGQGLSVAQPELAVPLRILEGLGFCALYTLFFIFPGGRFAPRWTFYLWLAILVPGVVRTAFPDWIPIALYQGWSIFWMASLLFIQIYRYRKIMNPVEKQQTKWAVFGMAAAMAGLFSITLLFLFANSVLQRSPILLFAADGVLELSMLLMPVALAFALLKRRLWDIDPIVNRTVVYGALSLFVVAAYVLIVWYLGTILRTSSTWFGSIVAAGVVAVLFAPLKSWLQRKVNRLMYGENDDPLSVLTRLGRSLENPLSPADALDVVVRTLKDALRVPYAGLRLHRDGASYTAAELGDRSEETWAFPLVHRGEAVGELLVAARSAGEAFTSSDRRFLDVLARHAGAVVQSAQATLDLQRSNEELRDSRERLVLAREEERRRLRRNLHDDLAPRLAALAFTASAGETLLESDPAKTKAILAELQTVIRMTVTDIRRLVHDLRPPALDELGLVGAIRERMNDLNRPLRPNPASGGGGSLVFRLEAPETLPPLPAAVEVAAFRIVTEAIVNVVRHARATECRVRILVSASGDGLELEVIDDGKGVGSGVVGGAAISEASAGATDEGAVREPIGGPGGIGLQSMRERAEELGGTCRLERRMPAGSRLWAYLPVAEQGSESA